jgi:hypothetical protein
MEEIKLVGGDFDGRVILVSKSVYDSGVLYVFTKSAFAMDVDYMSGCYDTDKVQYKKSLSDAHIWELVV